MQFIFLVPYMVYGINGASGFKQGFQQMLVIIYSEADIDWKMDRHTYRSSTVLCADRLGNVNCELMTLVTCLYDAITMRAKEGKCYG